MYVKVRIHTKMYDMPRIDVQQSITMYDNIRKYTNIYEMMFNYVRQCTTKTHHYDINVVAHKSFKCKTFFKNRGFSYEKLSITANNREKLKKKNKTSCEIPICTLSYLKSLKWDSTLMDFCGQNLKTYICIYRLIVHIVW